MQHTFFMLGCSLSSVPKIINFLEERLEENSASSTCWWGGRKDALALRRGEGGEGGGGAPAATPHHLPSAREKQSWLLQRAKSVPRADSNRKKAQIIQDASGEVVTKQLATLAKLQVQQWQGEQVALIKAPCRRAPTGSCEPARVSNPWVKLCWKCPKQPNWVYLVSSTF